MKLDETIKSIVEHPIATTIIVGSVMNGIAKIIAAARGIDTKPVMNVTISDKTKPNT